MSNLENNNKLNSNELSENELDNVSGGAWYNPFSWGKSDEKTTEGETQNQMSGGAGETTQDGAAVLANAGDPGATVPTGTETIVTPTVSATPATVEQNITGETKQSFSNGAGTNSKPRRRRRSF